MKNNYKNTHRAYGIYELFIKRSLDFLIALIGIILFCWLYAIIALLIRINLGSPVIFRQKRPGKDQKIFSLYKFRTMTDDRDENGELLPDDYRLTKFGKFLRSTSLDEIPEVINILNGDMSIIGPRPLLVKYLPYYTKEEQKRHNVRPGISGLAQVNGRNSISWNDKFKYDIQYVKKITFLNDMKIILKTVIKTVKREDIKVGSEFTKGSFVEERKSRSSKNNLKINKNFFKAEKVDGMVDNEDSK